MKKKLLILCIAFSVLLGCGKTNTQNTEESTDVIAEVDENKQDDTIDEGLNDLFNQCTGVTLWYDYTMNSGGKGPIYKLSVRGEVAELSVHASYEEKRTDYVIDKFYDLLELVKASNPKLYDINEHADENGKIIYETLNPAVQLYTHGKGYYLDIEDTGEIEAFFNDLIETSGFKDNADSTSAQKDIRENHESDLGDTQKTAFKKFSGPVANILIGGTRVRAEANNDSEIVARLEENEQVPVLDGTENNDWVKVEIDGNEGYVSKEYVVIKDYPMTNSGASSSQSSFNKGDIITIKATTNLRSNMDSSSSKVSVAYEGDTVEVIMSYEEGWTKVLYKKKEGYIRTDLLSK